MAQTLDEFVAEVKRDIDAFAATYRAQHLINPEHYPLQLGDDNSGLWLEFFMDSMTSPTTNLAPFDVDAFQEFVASHGFGEATAEGIRLGEALMLTGSDVASAAAEVSARGLTTDPEDER